MATIRRSPGAENSPSNIGIANNTTAATAIDLTERLDPLTAEWTLRGMAGKRSKGEGLMDRDTASKSIASVSAVEDDVATNSEQRPGRRQRQQSIDSSSPTPSPASPPGSPIVSMASSSRTQSVAKAKRTVPANAHQWTSRSTETVKDIRNRQQQHQSQQQQQNRQQRQQQQRANKSAKVSMQDDQLVDAGSWSAATRNTIRRWAQRLGNLPASQGHRCCWTAAGRARCASSTLRTLALLAVAAIVISSDVAVHAAQRESFKPKDPNGATNNANTIPNGNGNAVNSNANGNNNNISNGNGNGNGNALTSSVAHSNAINAIGSSATAFASAAAAAGGVGVGVGGSPLSSGSLQKSNINGLSIGGGISRNTIEMIEDNRNGGPYFDKGASKNVTALLGKTAYLNCRVKNLGNKTMLLQVSWVRHRDIHLLTVGRYTYTSDQRFRAIHQPQTEDWILQIKYPQHRDAGIYECQVSTTPHMSHYIHLSVVEPSTEIIGAPDLYIESGSTINLTCVILNSPEAPAYIFWNHNNAIINYDSVRGGVSVVTIKGETTTSFLLIKSARPSDSGHYQCNPSNAKPRSVTVHVLNGEFPAAMQRGAPVHQLRMSLSHYVLVYLSMSLFTYAYCKHSAQQLLPLRQLVSLRSLLRPLAGTASLLPLSLSPFIFHLRHRRRRRHRQYRPCCHCQRCQRCQQRRQHPQPSVASISD